MVAAAAIGFLVARTTVGTWPAPGDAPAGVGAAAKPSAATSTAVVSALPAMPREGLPIAETFDALADRARHGDLAANERLLRSLVHCRSFGDSYYYHYYQTHPESQTPLSVLRDGPTWFESGRVFCERLSIEQRMTEAEWLERAADAGDAEAMLCFALDAPLQQMRTMTPAALDLRRRYGAHARAYAERAFDRGYVVAAAALYASYAGMKPEIPTAWFSVPPGPRDLARAYGFARVQADRLGMSSDGHTDLGAAWSDRADLLGEAVSAEERERGDAFAREHRAATMPALRGLCYTLAVLP